MCILENGGAYQGNQINPSPSVGLYPEQAAQLASQPNNESRAERMEGESEAHPIIFLILILPGSSSWCSTAGGTFHPPLAPRLGLFVVWIAWWLWLKGFMMGFRVDLYFDSVQVEAKEDPSPRHTGWSKLNLWGISCCITLIEKGGYEVDDADDQKAERMQTERAFETISK